MTAPQTEEIRGHLKACWHCRAELEGIERTIGECVRYRKIVIDTGFPPPANWFDIYPHLAAIDESDRRRQLARSVLESFAKMLRTPPRWVPAAAMLLLIVVAVQQLRQAPSVKAAELLRKAMVAAESRPRAPRRIRIRTRTRNVTRVVGGYGPVTRTAAEKSLAGLESLFQAAHYSWEDPLSAKSYSDWRDQLADKRDEVTSEPGLFQVRTSTHSGELIEATLNISWVDLHTVGGTLQFRNHERVEIRELPDVPGPVPSQDGADAAPALPPFTLRPNRSAVLSAPARPGDELAVLAALHRIGADLGDPVEVLRSGRQILVTGTGIAAGRQQEIRDELQTMPGVVVRLRSEPASEDSAPEGRGVNRISVGPPTGRLQQEMEAQLGSRAAFEQFADRVLDMTDAFMARAHALRRLAECFPPDLERQMTPQQRLLLNRLLREHAEALRRNVTVIETEIRAALGTGPSAQQAAGYGPWQDDTVMLFNAARRSEVALVALLGASVEESQFELPAEVLASLTRLRSQAESYERLLARR
jgi:hypothetical protein